MVESPESGILGQSAVKVGVRDVAVAGSNDVLKKGLRSAFEAAIDTLGAKHARVEYAIASGMITSEIGLLELVHLPAPAGIIELAEGAEVVSDSLITALDIPIVFIRGVKNKAGENAALNEIRSLDFMRGEEVQMMGLVTVLRPKLPLNVVVLSSHTKLIHIDQAGRICGSMTTVSGGIYESLTTTLIAKNLRPGADDPPGTYSREEIIRCAAEGVEYAGFLRTMLMPRFMQVLMRTNVNERRLFVEAAIAAEDLAIFDEFPSQVRPNHAPYILLGQADRCQLYKEMLQMKYGKNLSVESVSDPEQIASYTVQGAIAVATQIEKSGKIKTIQRR